MDHRGGGGTSPVFNYPYGRTRDALERMRRLGEWDACHGLKMRYTNPTTGNDAMATMGTFVQLLPAGFRTAAYRSTDATVFAPIEGQGRSTVTLRNGGEFVVEWGKRDLFVVPSWHKVRHEAHEDMLLYGGETASESHDLVVDATTSLRGGRFWRGYISEMAQEICTGLMSGVSA